MKSERYNAIKWSLLTPLCLVLSSCVTFESFSSKTISEGLRLTTAKIVDRTLVVDSVEKFRLEDQDTEADMLMVKFIDAETLCVSCWNHKVLYIFDISNHVIHLEKKISNVAMFAVDQERLLFYLKNKKDSLFIFEPHSKEIEEISGNPIFEFNDPGLRYLGGRAFFAQLGDKVATFDLNGNEDLHPVKNLSYAKILRGSNPPGSIFVFSPDIYLTELSSSSLASGQAEDRATYYLRNPNYKLNYLPGGMIDRVEYVGSGLTLMFLYTGERRFPVDYPIYLPFLLYKSVIYQLPADMRQLTETGESFYVVPK